MEIDTSPGAITRVPGFRAAAVACGLKQNGQADLALVVCDCPANAAAAFTSNAFRAAPVLYDQELLARCHCANLRAIVANAGNANACTGEQGMRDAGRTARLAESLLNLPRDSAFVMSTGIIGHPMPMAKLEAGLRAACGGLSPTGGADAARAIMTTDLVPKEASASFPVGRATVTLGGMAKGSGMIAPNLVVPAHPGAGRGHATMLSALVTDADVSTDALHAALGRAVAASFNCITVDGDTSTNDTVVLLASGGAGNTRINVGSGAYPVFEAALVEVCTSLARQIARDGEGATRLVEMVIQGAASDAEALQAAKVVATSPLVKTAIFGADPNWGRVLAAIGRSGSAVNPAQTALWLGDIQLVAGGEPLHFDLEAARATLKQPEVRFTARLGVGSGQATVWTCDLSYKYVEINAEYHT
jgi:glutamate N-acetyltransferase/amino-acid N-acetyltransferase